VVGFELARVAESQGTSASGHLDGYSAVRLTVHGHDDDRSKAGGSTATMLTVIPKIYMSLRPSNFSSSFPMPHSAHQ